MPLTIISKQFADRLDGNPMRTVTAAEARQAARLAHVDFKSSNSFGGITLPAGIRLQTGARRDPQNDRRRPRRAGPTYVVGIEDERFEKPVINHLWRKRVTEPK